MSTITGKWSKASAQPGAVPQHRRVLGADTELVDAVTALVQRQGQQVDHLNAIIDHVVIDLARAHDRLDELPRLVRRERHYWLGMGISFIIGISLGAACLLLWQG